MTNLRPSSFLRADLHVHSCHSLQSGNLRFLKSRDCYSAPEAVYRAAKVRGMDLVTITDHDSIQGCLELLDRRGGGDDVFVSEEVSCRFPDTDLEVHFGVYGTNETLHAALQPLRGNAFEVAAALREAGVFFSLNHLLHFYRGQVPLVDYLRLLEMVPALETRNGTMLAAHNELVALVAKRRRGGSRMGVVGGSDAHTLRRIGRTWTSVHAATTGEFLRSLAAGRAEVGGNHGSASCIAADAYGVIAAYVGSLLGFGPRDHTMPHRLGCLLFSVATLPAQFLPLAITAAGKYAEAREVRRAHEALAHLFHAPGADSTATVAPAADPDLLEVQT
jgi:predicted metal-dependent phosphoesterase TrpH